MSLPILQAPALRALESAHAAASPPLMERAGAGAARVALQLLTGRALVLAGPGNNGGDAFVVARLLKAAGHTPVVLFAGDPARLPADARQAFDAWLADGGTCQFRYPPPAADAHVTHNTGSPPPFGLIIDGLFGIGLSRAIEGLHADWIAAANASGTPILALDTPSGLNALTGQITGPVIRASHTVTFIALKPGLLTGDGPDVCGEITLCDLGLPVGEQTGGRCIDPLLFNRSLKPRLRNTHKGSYGNVAIIGGAAGMAGAALLAGRAALRLGAGRVYLGMLERLAVDPDQPELMLRTPAEALGLASVLAIGPGLGQSAQANECLARCIDAPLPLVLDADALNLLAQSPALATAIAARPAPTLLTPHPAEAARLLGCSTAAIQADRLSAALELAKRLGAAIALKGCGTLVATPDGNWFINTTGNPGLATAGSGDVLTGMLAALLAQGWTPLEALTGAVHLHGAAADACVADGIGPIGLTAGELIDPARHRLNRWIHG